jgi:hypothetical protein
MGHIYETREADVRTHDKDVGKKRRRRRGRRRRRRRKKRKRKPNKILPTPAKIQRTLGCMLKYFRSKVILA